MPPPTQSAAPLPNAAPAPERLLASVAPPPSGGGRPLSRLRRSLIASTAEGIFADVINALLSGGVLTGFALYLGAGPLVVGILGALPFAAQFIHLPSAWVTTALGRRRVAIWAVTASREIYWPLVALPFLPLSREGRLSVLIAVAAISAVLAVIGNNAWTAWMGALVPDKLRGRYFGRRTAICTLGGTTASLLSGSILDLAGASHLEGVVYSLLAAVAAISGIVTAFLLAQQHEPEPQPGVAPTLSLEALRAPLRDPAARRYLAYLVAWNAAVGLAGPLFSIHMLENLKMGFLLMGLQVAGVAAVRFLAVPLWGRALDKVGSRPVLLACSFGISIVPLVWLFPRPGALWPIALDSLLSGVLWSGHGLASFALPLSLAPKSQRPFYLATFSAAGGLAFGTAATLGGAIAEHLPRDILVAGQPMFGLQELFVASALLRLIAAVIGLRVVEPGARSIEQLVQMGTRYLVRLPLRLTQEVLARR